MSSYPKGDRSTRQRAAEPRKRKFHGNRFTSVSSDDGDSNTSRSEQKLKTASSDDIIIRCYRIIEFISVFLAISKIAICRSCKQKLTFAESGHRGLGFKIIVQKFGIMYSNYIGDGDSKTFTGILNINPYGDECIVTKNECVGHVEKRMGTRLRNKRKTEKLGGRKGLTESVIKKLTIYYGLAIRRNVNSVEGMKKAIMATLDHYCSTDDNSRHENCPEGAESWCEWRKAQAANNLASFNHPARLINENVEKHIRPIYEDLSNDDLLTRCLGGHTQNSNEAFNSLLWRLNPKHLNSGYKIVEIAANLAAGIFNEGYSAVLSTMQLLDFVIGQQCKNFADTVDAERITRENRRA